MYRSDSIWYTPIVLTGMHISDIRRLVVHLYVTVITDICVTVFQDYYTVSREHCNLVF